MKTAVCLSGQPREVAECWPSLAQHLLPHLPEPDLFVHTSEPYPQDFLEVLAPKAYRVEEQVRHPELEALFARVGYHSQPHANSFIQESRGWREVGRLKSDYESKTGVHYNWVVKTRPDLFYLRDIPFDLYDPGRLNTLDPGVLSAEFVAGPGPLLDAYFGFFDWLQGEGEHFLRPDHPLLKESPHAHPGYTGILMLEVYLLDRQKLEVSTKPTGCHSQYCFYRIRHCQQAGTYRHIDEGIKEAK